MRTEQQTGAADQRMSMFVTRETREGNVSQLEMERNTYQEISSIIVQNGILENSQYCEINDVEITVKQEGKDRKRGRDNVASRKTESPGKLESKQTGSTTIRLRTIRLRHFVYRHFVFRHFVYYCIPGYRTVIHPTSVSANNYFHQFQLLLAL